MSTRKRSGKPRVLLLSYVFSPSIGGIETASELVASELTKRGYHVVVATQTPERAKACAMPFRVVRQPRPLQLLSLIRWADVVIQSNISLKLAWPLYGIFFAKPLIIVLQTPISRPNGVLTWRDALKRYALKRAHCLSVSSFLADTLPVKSSVIGNPYADHIFQIISNVPRTDDLLFVGRLAEAKGVDILIRALGLLRDRGICQQLSIVGIGPEEGKLRQLAHELELNDKIRFLGPRQGHQLARIMNEHSIVAVPSRQKPIEALGIVAIEAIACGCAVVASNTGGLPEAVGSCGLLFENENPTDLADQIQLLITNRALLRTLTARSSEHVSASAGSAIADAYEQHIASVLMDRPAIC